MPEMAPGLTVLYETIVSMNRASLTMIITNPPKPLSAF